MKEFYFELSRHLGYEIKQRRRHPDDIMATCADAAIAQGIVEALNQWREAKTFIALERSKLASERRTLLAP